MLNAQKRKVLEGFLREIEQIEKCIENPQDEKSLVTIINQAQTIIATTDHFFARERLTDSLTSAMKATLVYKNNQNKSLSELVDITTKVYVTIESYLMLSQLQ